MRTQLLAKSTGFKPTHLWHFVCLGCRFNRIPEQFEHHWRSGFLWHSFEGSAIIPDHADFRKCIAFTKSFNQPFPMSSSYLTGAAGLACCISQRYVLEECRKDHVREMKHWSIAAPHMASMVACPLLSTYFFSPFFHLYLAANLIEHSPSNRQTICKAAQVALYFQEVSFDFVWNPACKHLVTCTRLGPCSRRAWLSHQTQKEQERKTWDREREGGK